MKKVKQPALAKLEQACALYAAQNPELDLETESLISVVDFAQWLCEENLFGFKAINDKALASDAAGIEDAGWPTLEFKVGLPETPACYPLLPDGQVCEHIVLVVGDHCVDWTARNFNPDAPMPLIFPKAAVPVPVPWVSPGWPDGPFDD